MKRNDEEDEEQDSEGSPQLSRRASDLTKTMLPLPVVWILVVTSITAAGGVWAVFGKVDILSERQEAAKALSAVHMENLNEGMKSVRSRQELQQYEIQQLKDTVQELKILVKERNQP